MQNVLHERLNSSATIAVMPCDDVVHRIGVRPLYFWAHVFILLFQSRKIPCHEKTRAPAPVNQSGIKSEICPCETSRRGFVMPPLSSSTVMA